MNPDQHQTLGSTCRQAIQRVFAPRSVQLKPVLAWLALYSAITAGWYMLWRGNPQIAEENCAMESFEALCLFVGILLFGGAIHSAAGAPQRILFLGLTLFYLTVLVLEVDTRNMSVPVWVVRISNGTIRNLWLGGLWVIAAALFLRQPRPVLSCFFSWLPSAAGRIMLCSGFFWGAALIAEKRFHVSFFVEELLECNAALLTVQSAWLTFRQARFAQEWPLNDRCGSDCEQG